MSSSEVQTLEDSSSDAEIWLGLFQIFIRNSKIFESFVDCLTEEDIDGIRKKVFCFWETKQSRQVAERSKKVTPVAEPIAPVEPPAQTSEEAGISSEDTKPEEAAGVIVHPVKFYSVEQLLEAELKDIQKSKISKLEESSKSAHEARSPETEKLDFTDLENKAAGDIPKLGFAKEKEKFSVISTDVLEVLLRVYKQFTVNPLEAPSTQLEEVRTSATSSIKDFKEFLLSEMHIIYDRLSSIVIKDPRTPIYPKSSLKKKPAKSTVIFSPLEPSSGYPEFTTRTDDTPSSLPYSTLDSASGLAENLDVTGSSRSSEGSGNTTEENTLSGISSITTDPRVSVSSLKDIDVRLSVSSLRNRASLSSMQDIYPATSTLSCLVTERKTSADIESICSSNILLDDEASDDAFLNVPLVEEQTEGNQQNPRRRGRSLDEDRDRSEAKRPAK